MLHHHDGSRQTSADIAVEIGHPFNLFSTIPSGPCLLAIPEGDNSLGIGGGGQLCSGRNKMSMRSKGKNRNYSICNMFGLVVPVHRVEMLPTVLELEKLCSTLQIPASYTPISCSGYEASILYFF